MARWQRWTPAEEADLLEAVAALDTATEAFEAHGKLYGRTPNSVGVHYYSKMQGPQAEPVKQAATAPTIGAPREIPAFDKESVMNDIRDFVDLIDSTRAENEYLRQQVATLRAAVEARDEELRTLYDIINRARKDVMNVPTEPRTYRVNQSGEVE